MNGRVLRWFRKHHQRLRQQNDKFQLKKKLNIWLTFLFDTLLASERASKHQRSPEVTGGLSEVMILFIYVLN